MDTDNTSTVFLNYRWLDSSDATGRIYRDLSLALKKENIFLDHHNIDYGDKISDRISKGIQNAKVLLVIIGKNWLDLLLERSKSGKPDWVTNEIKAALKLDNCRVVPVFLPGVEVDVAQWSNQHPLLNKLLQLEAFSISKHREWDIYLNLLADKIREWTLPDPESYLKMTLKGLYQTNPVFTTIGFPADRDSSFQTFSMDDYFITPSYISFEDMRKRDDWRGKEKESSSHKIRQQRFRLQNFIHQDYVSLRLLDSRENVLIIGNPGVGKSTFARWICYQWAQNVDNYSSIPFYIPLREISLLNATLLWEYIARQLMQSDIAAAQILVQKVSHRIQWILDGYDELSQGNQLQLYKSVQSLTEPSPRYVLLSRPYGLLFNPGFSFDLSLQLDGFNYGQIVDYSRRFLQINGNDSKQEQLLRLLRENKVLEDYAHNPMMLSFILSLFLTELNPVKTLSQVQSQYQLQAMVYGWIRAREEKKGVENKLPKNLDVTKEHEEFAYKLEINREFIYQEQKGLGDFHKAGISLSNMGLGRMDTVDNNHAIWSFSFNSVTFQEFLAARYLRKLITPDAFFMLCRVSLFWNFSKMIIGCLCHDSRETQAKTIIQDILERYLNSTERNHFHFYLFAVQLSETPKAMVNQLLDVQRLQGLYEIFIRSGTYSSVWKSLLMEAIRKLYFKIDRRKQQQLKSWILKGITPEPGRDMPGEERDPFDVQDGVKQLVQQLELWNDPSVISAVLDILEQSIPLMEADGDFDIYAYEPISFILEDVLARCSTKDLIQIHDKLLPILDALPNEFIGATTRLKGLMMNDPDIAWDRFLFETKAIETDLNERIKLSKRAKKALFEHFKSASEYLFYWGKGRIMEPDALKNEVIEICHFFDVATRITQIIEIDDYNLEEIFQLSTESVSSLRDIRVCQAVFDFAAVIRPSYSGVVFFDAAHFSRWYEETLEAAITQSREDRLFWFVNTLTLADILQTRFVKFKDAFCTLMRLYVQKHRTVFSMNRGGFTEAHFENAADPALEILRPFEKLVYFGREENSWGEADKLALIDMGLEAEFREMPYFSDNFLPGLMGTQFNLYRKEHWEFVHSCCTVERLPALFSILRNKQIYRFASNIPPLIPVAIFIRNNADATHLDDRPSLVIELAARCLRLIHRNLDTTYQDDAEELLTIIQSILLNPKVQQGFLQEDCIGGLEGEDALAFVLCHYILPNDRLCFVNDYDAIFGDHYRERRAFIEGLVEFFSDKDGLNFDELRSVYPHIGAKMADKMEYYVRINEWEYRFEVEAFEEKLALFS